MKDEDEIIEKYLNNKLSKEEEVIFTKKLESNNDFRVRVEFEKSLNASLNNADWDYMVKSNENKLNSIKKDISQKEVEEIKESLKEASKSYKRSIKGNRTHIMYALAASLALFFIINFFSKNVDSNSDLYYKYLKTSDLPSFTSRNENSDENLIQAQRYFNDKNYSKALKIFKSKLSKESKEDARFYIYTGIAQMELNKFGKAENTFNELISSDLLDAQKGYWYKALLYLKMNKVEESKLLLEEIIDKSYFNNEKAIELLRKLS